MASKISTREGRQNLRESLLRDSRSGVLRPGDALPTVRELAGQHGLSPATVQRELRTMADEGILLLRQGSGAFMAHLPEHQMAHFAAVFGDEVTSAVHLGAMRDGFEAEVASRGASSIILTPSSRGRAALFESLTGGQLRVAGTFFYPSSAASAPDPSEWLGSLAPLCNGPGIIHNEDPANRRWSGGSVTPDTIRFDDHDGAGQAVRLLWRRGYRRMAFLALHGEGGNPTRYLWSRWREEGFFSALANLRGSGLAFHPPSLPATSGHKDQQDTAYRAAGRLIPLLKSKEIQAVVCVNQLALKGLFLAASEARLPADCWPAVIAFDDPGHEDNLLSVLKLPWEQLGRVAARALWERHFGSPAQRSAPPRDVLVPMQLITRLSCIQNPNTMAMADAAVSDL